MYHELAEFDFGSTDKDTKYEYIKFNATEYYSCFLLQVTSIYATGGSHDAVAIPEIRYFGTREKGASTLHNGELALTRNLTVPRLGPGSNYWLYMVPRRDRLIVEFDTSTRMHGTDTNVIDTSGNENHGTYSGGAYYNQRERAFRLPETEDFILFSMSNTPLRNNMNGGFSVSIWYKSLDTGGDNETLFQIPHDYGDSISAWGLIESGGELRLDFINNSAKTGVVTDVYGQWNHVVMTYNGDGQNGRAIYFNGVKRTDLGAPTGTDAGTNLNADWGNDGRIGAFNSSTGSTTHELNGWVSGFRLYDCVLGLGEVQQLYRMGRNGPGSYMNIVDTAVCVGNRAPRAQFEVVGKIIANGGVTNFTGQHRCVPSEPMDQGLIVSADKNEYVSITGGVKTGTKAITVDESLPIVSLSKTVNDKKCFGVISSVEKANTVTRSETGGGLISEEKKILGDNRAVVNSVGEGAIWVCDAGGPLDSGDFITTSNVAGYGQKQESEFLANYTVAKITMDCDFTASNVAVRAIKKEVTGLRTITEDTWNLLSEYDRDQTTETQYSNTLTVAEWSNLTPSGYVPTTVTTTVDYTDGSNLISITEWSNLAPSDQELYTANTHTEITDYTKFVTAEEWSNLAPDVQGTFSETEVVTYYRKQWGENVLDERGNLIWEDKTGEFEAPYKIRFLDATGAQTDEANAVHRAAFVGCTYHCG